MEDHTIPNMQKFHQISRIVVLFFCCTWLGLYRIFFTQLTEAKKQFFDALADVNLLGWFFFSAQTSLNKAAAFSGGWRVIYLNQGTNY